MTADSVTVTGPADGRLGGVTVCMIGSMASARSHRANDASVRPHARRKIAILEVGPFWAGAQIDQVNDVLQRALHDWDAPAAQTNPRQAHPDDLP
jgi:hypothetical protein